MKHYKLYKDCSCGDFIENIGSCVCFKEIDTESDIVAGEILKIGERFYVVSATKITDELFLRKEGHFNLNKLSTDDERNITCPICGFVDVDSWEFEEDSEYVCPHCGAKLSVERNYSYDTTVVQRPIIKIVESDGVI